ncbi:hypothetical protein LOTGIDRAFT_108343 [Lottia gigantea]|uniref:G-protein coupled receptors family 1 profile domain-containing protein n=1 Tax=Lottia gigantea TaxID=225164 RepID=V3ZSS6_LOTGI|nr:hypothetical protein LOTGIDRAFT_108343 [Lottia gigantea]ESO83941.1 hypothetical protein LOTGIDRAFT_108343 [Lottia gigantea]
MGIFNPFTTGDGPEAILVPIAFGIIFLIGIIGNGTLIFTVLFNKVMRNVPNVFIVSLSIGDLLLILVSVPFSATIFTFKGWPYGDFTCRLNYFLETLSLGVSVFTLTALSIDRYMVIVNPMSKHTSKTMAKTVVIAVFIWCLAAILAIPDAVVSHVEDIPLMNISKTLPICFNYPTDVPDYEKYNVCIKFMIYFAIPLVVIAVFYILMARVLIKSGEMMPCEGRGANNHQRQIAARKKVAKVVMSFVLIFAVCWLPRYIYLMWYYFDDSQFNHFWIAFKIIGFCLTFINSCVNPFALYFLSGQFRKYYNRYLFRCIPKVRYTSLEPSSTMHNFNSTVRRASSTTTTIVQSQSMC